MKFLSSVLFLLIFSTTVLSQSYSFSNAVFESYEEYKEESIQKRRFKHSDIEPLIKSLEENSQFEVKTAGHSVEGRPIYLIKLGSGDKKVLFWSQMHGDESTATMALFDLFNFFKANNGGYEYEINNILESTTLYFIPMLNPDGAEKFQRRNALGIDVNRDALRLTSPEAQILKSVRDSLNPDFGFNLHDQSTYYTAGRASEAATLSFLAPAYDFEQSENEIRTRAMKLIAYLNPMLQQFIPDGIAKYSDEHEPRAFGDMIQKWGTSTILIESGGYPSDPEKQFIRKLNYVTLLSVLEAIADDSYGNFTVEDYFKIPENKSYLTDLLLRNATVVIDDNEYLMDINIRHQQRMVGEKGDFYYRGSISDLGDLSTQYGYKEIDAKGLKVYPGQIHPDTLENEEMVKNLNFSKMLSEGYTDVIVRNAPDTSFVSDVPLNIVSREGYENSISLGALPNLVLKEGDEIRYVIVNGFAYDASEGAIDSVLNALVIK